MAEYSFKFDGYAVGERLLDHVLFDVIVKGDPDTSLVVHSVTVGSKYKAYFEKLNGDHWLKEISDYITADLATMIEEGSAREVLTDLDDDGCYEW